MSPEERERIAQQMATERELARREKVVRVRVFAALVHVSISARRLVADAERVGLNCEKLRADLEVLDATKKEMP